MKQSSLHLKAHRWHKRFGLALAIVTIMWGLSGIAHPIMSRIKPVAQAQLPLQNVDLEQTHAVSQLLRNTGISQDMLILPRHDASPVLALMSQNSWQYFDANTGSRLPDFHQTYIATIGSVYAGLEQKQVESITVVDEFSYDYPMINRFLPAYKIQFKDDLDTAVYLDTQSLQLASVSNKYKAFYTRWFSHLHSWDFIPNTTLRYSLMFMVTVLLFLSALLGIYLTLHRWRKGALHRGSKSRRAHRYIGLFVCLAALAFSFSGGFHAFNKLTGVSHNYNKHPQQTQNQHKEINSNDFSHLWNQFTRQENPDNIQQIQFLMVAGQAAIQIHRLTEAPQRHAGHQHGNHKKMIRGAITYFPDSLMRHGQPVKTQKLYLQQLVNQTLPLATIRESHLQPHFNHEYGFIDKKLPTYRVQTETNVYFFDPTAQSLSKTVSQQALLESLSFSTLHKASFLDGLGKDIRDILIVLFVLGIIVITALGLRLTLKKRR